MELSQMRGVKLLFLDCSAEIVNAFTAFENCLADDLSPRKSELRIVCSQSLKHPQLRRLSEDDCPILLVGVFPGAVTLGPLQIRSHSVCLACVQYWATVAEWRPPKPLTSYPCGHQSLELVLQHTAEAVMEFHHRGTIADLEDSVTMIDVETGTSTRHHIFSRSNCPACGANLRTRDLWVHCSPVTGIVKHFKRFDGVVDGVFQARALFASPVGLPGNPRSLGTAWGRGVSADQAAYSCIGEALESYSATYRGDETMVSAPLYGVQGAIDPRSILLYSQAQYQNREHLNQHLPERHAIPQRFDPSQPIDWLSGRDLSNGEQIWLPAALCLLSYSFQENTPQFAVATRAGCASGISFSDALAGALVELIEQDAVGIWWYNQIRRPSVRLESFDSPSLLVIRDGFQARQRDFFLLDITTDIGIPTYVAVSAAIGGTELLLGAAAHPSPRIAAEQAATEVAQRWLCTKIAQMPSDFFPWMREATLTNQLHCNPSHEVNAPSQPAQLTAPEIVDMCVQRLDQINVRPVAVDLSRSDVALRTARVVAPGLRSVYNRRAPGRLYQVPVQLGWIREMKHETRLNPFSCVF